MKHTKTTYLLAAILILSLGAGACHLTLGKPKQGAPISAAQSSVPAGTRSTNPEGEADVDPEKVTENVANFIGDLTPGGTAESAGHDRNYIVSYQVDFMRKKPDLKAPEESLSYEKLRDRDMDAMPLYVYYGETVTGKFDPVNPAVIAIRAQIDGKEASGYVDAHKLWLEPALDHPLSDRYMAVTHTVSVRVVPTPSSPAVLTLLQGEVVDVVGQLNFQGRSWIKARFNATERPRYGFIAGNDVMPLSLASVNQSALVEEEVPGRIRSSDLKFSGPDRKQLSENGFYIEPIPPSKEVTVDDMADAYTEPSGGEQFFITSDLFLHSYHLIFDRMLQDIEEMKFRPAATNLSVALAKTTEGDLKIAPSSL